MRRYFHRNKKYNIKLDLHKEDEKPCGTFLTNKILTTVNVCLSDLMPMKKDPSQYDSKPDEILIQILPWRFETTQIAIGKVLFGVSDAQKMIFCKRK